MTQYLLGIDQGTSSSRAVLFDHAGNVLHTAQQEFNQTFPQDGWVEQDPQTIWQTTLTTCQQVLAQAKITAAAVAAIGISNQRETTIVWERSTGQPIYPAIGWQDRRTAKICADLGATLPPSLLQEKTGLLLDPYFSATKIHWILTNVAGARQQAEQGELLFGTVDTFLLWRLTGGNSHKTDATNAARTLLFNIHTQQWDDELLKIFDIPRAMLPEVLDNSADFGKTDPAHFGGAIAIAGMVGDQQGALFGQACFTAGMVKSTYGTGAFVVGNTGSTVAPINDQLISTVAYRLKGVTTYALEGSIFVSGSAIKWLRDKLQVIDSSSAVTALMQTANPNDNTYFVPAFTGMGAPYWDPAARGSLLGMTLDTGIAEIVHAAVAASCYQTKDVINAMNALGGTPVTSLRVDGGMASNAHFLQLLADIVDVTVEQPVVTETSVLGAVYLAGLQVGIFKSLDDITQHWQLAQQFTPKMSAEKREVLYAGWQKAVQRVLK